MSTVHGGYCVLPIEIYRPLGELYSLLAVQAKIDHWPAPDVWLSSADEGPKIWPRVAVEN